jgi:hypothetical protein
MGLIAPVEEVELDTAVLETGELGVDVAGLTDLTGEEET